MKAESGVAMIERVRVSVEEEVATLLERLTQALVGQLEQHPSLQERLVEAVQAAVREGVNRERRGPRGDVAELRELVPAAGGPDSAIPPRPNPHAERRHAGSLRPAPAPVAVASG